MGKSMPVSEYLRRSFEPHCEYVDGELLPRQPKDDECSSLFAALVGALSRRDRALGLRVRPSRHIRISPTRYRVPDVAVFLDSDPQVAATVAPLFTVEIASRSEAWSGVMGRISDHLAMGVGMAFVVDPHARSVLAATPGQSLHQLTPPLKVPIDIPNRGTLELDFDQIFAEMD
ncbi:MAG: Uma2 family endonuclease [Bryobacterales bacterium]|nr:Uma2 family endonuclease [Bryobacterales bacterium]